MEAEQYSYLRSIKTDRSDELINTYALRPVAGLIVRALYQTRVTPNHVTIGAAIVGLVAAGFYGQGGAATTAIGGILVTLKDLLDSADGQLARAKQQYSRVGRFLDSIGDVLVNAAVFSAIGMALWTQTGRVAELLLAFAGFAGITLRVSYHVFYQTAYLHLQNQYALNRLTEEVKEEDRLQGGEELVLQNVFQGIYGWQDKLMMRIDVLCRKGREDGEFLKRWYDDGLGLRLSGFIGMGTELFLLTVCSVLNKLEIYLLLNLVLMNGVWVASVLYRRIVLLGRLG